jgi:uncharacterized SAM-binding protein YcdF (DUF218 family)
LIQRIFSLLVIVWALGFVWFAMALPQPAADERTDSIVVPTGSGGRIPHGLELLRRDLARTMLVTGVDVDVKPAEFAAEFGVDEQLMECCITLGFDALDTRGNAEETAQWLAANGHKSLRLVTSDWHMRRTAVELEDVLPDDVEVVEDAIPTGASFPILFMEYNKLLAAWLLHWV